VVSCKTPKNPLGKIGQVVWQVLQLALLAPLQADDPPASPADLPRDSLAIVSALESATTSAISKAERSVVAISRVRTDQVARAQLDNLRNRVSLQITEDPTSEDYVPQFFGSGVVVSHDGFIVTCAHVLDDPARFRYYVWLDHRCYSAKVVAKSATAQAADPFSDLAVLKIDADDLQAITLAKEPVKRGQFAIALGNPYAIARDGQASASWGMIGNTQRFAPKDDEGLPAETIHQLGTLIQTDLRLAVGSSGGALINLHGDMVGLTTGLVAGRGWEQSAGFAIATDDFFRQVVDTLKQGKQPEYGFLGIQPENLRAYEKEQGLSGARVSLVIPGLPGSLAGLRDGDVISQVDDTAIRSRNDLFRELSKVPTGRKTKLVVQRVRGSGTPQTMHLEAELTKKFLATNRPAYSLHGPPVWRGAQVEYQSAIAGELERIAVASTGPRVAFLSVSPDSACWRAGLRAGFGIVTVAGSKVETPAQFHELVAQRPAEVELVVVTSTGKQILVKVPVD
jgi:serine protease Do